MSDLNPELFSLYADSQATPEQVREVEQAIASDPGAAAQLEELRNLGELFAPQAEERISDDLEQRLYELGRTAPIEQFKAVRVEAPRRSPWTRRVAAVAALLLVAVGILKLAYRPEVEVTLFTRQTLAADGDVTSTERLEQRTMHAGDVLRTGARERISCRLPGGAMVVLLANSQLSLGDPRDRELFELDRGIALCTVAGRTKPRLVHVAGYEISADEAHFGVRVRPGGLRGAGPALAAGGGAEVTVAVSRGSLEVADDGMRERVRAGRRVVFRDGATTERSEVWRDPLYVHLMRHFRVISREVLPGYFTGERGVTPIPVRRWSRRPDRSLVYVLSSTEGADMAHYLVLQVRASKPTPLLLTRVMPDPKRPGWAETATVETDLVGEDWTVIAIARTAFDEPAPGRTVERKNRRIPAGRSRLTRLELRPAIHDASVVFELKACLWAARPPTDLSEVVK